ncbi:MAG: LytTR family DNA-binding domain-containing protein [Rikenellaceae bacterium]
MRQLKTIVIDDEPLAALLLEGYVAKTPFLEHTATFATAVEAINSEALAEADLLLLDIQMPTLTGLEFSRMVNERTRIIFTTAFNQYAIDGYKVNALDYLLKPISYVDFLEAVQKAVDWFALKERAETSIETTKSEESEEESIDSIYVKSEYKLIRIELDSLLYVEGLKDYVKFQIEGENRAILSLMNMKRVEDMLPKDQFIRVHRSFIVRKDKIKVIERSRILFDNECIPIGENYKSQLQEYLKVRSI